MDFFETGVDTFKREKLKERYDVVVIGGGPAGMSSALYARRSGLSVLVVEKVAEGGQMLLTNIIENYPGFRKITGDDLAKKMKEHAGMFGAEFISGEVVRMEDFHSDEKKIILRDGRGILSKVIILAMGASPKELGVPGEREFKAKGVSYCAVCDGHFFAGKHVVVVGGGDTAIEEALFLSNIASKVTVVHRRDKLRAVKYLQERAFGNERIEFIWNSIVKEIKGDEKVRSIILENVKTGESVEYPIDAVFVSIGLKPASEVVRGIVDMDDNGFIFTDENMETNIEGIFAVGDVRVKPLRQVITAVSDGAIAATMAARKYFD